MKYLNRTLIFSFTVLAMTFFLMSCQIETKRTQDEDRSTLVDPKYSLTQDRSEFEKIRENIPAEVRKKNDEKSLLAEWMLGFRLSPNEIRERYDNLVRKKRDLFSADLSKSREDYSRTEKKNRDALLRGLETERNDFSKGKKSREERADFYNRLDDKRRNYFAEEREKKDEFESIVRDQRKNFEDYLKEKNLDFNSELKAYTENWNSQKKVHD